MSNFRLFQLRKEYNPGDLGFDPLNLAPSDEKTFETRQNQELSHGRLAMVTIFGFIVQELKARPNNNRSISYLETPAEAMHRRQLN